MVMQTIAREQTRAELVAWERQYGMSSDLFLRKQAAGELDDRLDFFRWHALCFLAEELGLLTIPPGAVHRTPAPSLDGNDDADQRRAAGAIEPVHAVR